MVSDELVQGNGYNITVLAWVKRGAVGVRSCLALMCRLQT
jgi:hypothetical protein